MAGDETLGAKINFPGAAKTPEAKKEDDGGWFATAKKRLAETLSGTVKTKAKSPTAKPSSTLGNEIGYPGSK